MVDLDPTLGFWLNARLEFRKLLALQISQPLWESMSKPGTKRPRKLTGTGRINIIRTPELPGDSDEAWEPRFLTLRKPASR